MTRYHLTIKSRNAKTGPIPVSTTSADTCPPSCPLQGTGCYAEHGHLGLHWRQVSAGSRGDDLAALCRQVEALPAGQLWRHNQAGDLPGKGNRINRAQLARLVDANRGKRGFTYTHKPPTKANLSAIQAANAAGFTINLSANNAAHADTLALHGPTVTIQPVDAPKVSYTPAGRRIVRCPATWQDTNCSTCQLCARPDREYIIGFPAHGSGAGAADIIARG